MGSELVAELTFVTMTLVEVLVDVAFGNIGNIGNIGDSGVVMVDSLVDAAHVEGLATACEKMYAILFTMAE